MKKLVYLFTLCAIVLASCSKPKTPATPVEEYYAKVQKGEYQDAISKHTKDGFINSGYHEKLKSSVEAKGTMKSFVVGEATMIDENNATVKVTVTYEKDGVENVEEVVENVENVDGKWLMIFSLVNNNEESNDDLGILNDMAEQVTEGISDAVEEALE